MIGLSALCEVVYFLLLGGAYTGGQLSLMYPISRGSTPVFTTLIAVTLIGERVSALGLAGIALVVGGIYILHLRNFRRAGWREPFSALRERTSQFALLSGLAVAGYSTVDKLGVAHVDPPVYMFLVFGLTMTLLAPYLLLCKRDAMCAEWRSNWRSILLTGATLAVGYLLILFILTTNKVSYATSVRGASVVFGAWLGAFVLKEGMGDKKILGALVIFAGIICIGLAA
ncbi:MAG: membrane protein [Candidatus Roseilinea sp.]|nr:MAG: membrane protein [Candidatus Roseilinea sp.]